MNKSKGSGLMGDNKNKSTIVIDDREVFHAIWAASPTAMYVKDLEGRFLLANKLYCKWSGFVEDEILGKKSHDLFPKEFADRFVEMDEFVLSTGKISTETNYEVLNKQGKKP